MGALEKAQKHFRGRGLAEGARSLATDLKGSLTREREAILLAVDLTDPKNRRRPKDSGITLSIFPGERWGQLREMLRLDAPAEVARVEKRARQGMSGLIAWEGEEPLGFVFWVAGSGAQPPVHPDLPWLGLRPGPDEVYCFDYFLKESARGKGATFVRAVQERHHQLGYRRAYGYVYADNTPALWLYRTTGWKEIGRVKEVRWLERVVFVDGAPYWMEAHRRRRLG